MGLSMKSSVNTHPRARYKRESSLVAQTRVREYELEKNENSAT